MCDEMLCIHLQFTKLASDSDVTSSQVHTTPYFGMGTDWGHEA
jgi:hypothetical protein